MHIANLDNPGDWCIVGNALNPVVCMACPVCGGIFVCKDHKIEKEDPLTLSPSVVGPDSASTMARMEVLAPCKHHFLIKDGNVIL